LKGINKAELLLEIHLKELGIEFETQVKLVPDRKWRWDFVVLQWAIEIQGAVFTTGKHTRGLGYTRDCEKMRAAVTAGYYPVYFTSQEVLKGVARSWFLVQPVPLWTGESFRPIQ